MRFSLSAFCLGTASLVLGAPFETPAQTMKLIERENGPFVAPCPKEEGRTITLSRQETGWAYPVAGTTCDAGSQSKSIPDDIVIVN